MRTRMSWEWVGDYPVFVYTTFVDHFQFDVVVKVCPPGEQNAKQDLLIPQYRQSGLASKNEVVLIALEKARIKLCVDPIDEDEEVIVPECCHHCGAFEDKDGNIKHFESCNPEAVYNYDCSEFDDDEEPPW